MYARYEAKKLNFLAQNAIDPEWTVKSTELPGMARVKLEQKQYFIISYAKAILEKF